MIWAFSYAWAASQRAAGYFHGNVECLAQALFMALPTWDNALPRDSKAIWLHRLGIDAILPEPEPRPTAIDNRFAVNWGDLDCSDRAAIEDMANYFRIGIPETTLLYRLGQALA